MISRENSAENAESGRKTIDVRPDGVTYEGPLYRNVGTLPDGIEFGAYTTIHDPQ